MLFELKDRKLYKFKTYILKIAKQFLHFLIIFFNLFQVFYYTFYFNFEYLYYNSNYKTNFFFRRSYSKTGVGQSALTLGILESSYQYEFQCILIIKEQDVCLFVPKDLANG